MSDASFDVNEMSSSSQPYQNEEESEFDFQQYWLIVKKRWWVLVLMVLIATTIAYIYTARQTRLYRATSTLIIDTSTNRNVFSGVQEIVQLGSAGYWASEAFYEKEYRVIMSLKVARRAGEKLGVVNDDDWTGLSLIKDAELREQKRLELDPADFIKGSYHVESEKSKNITHVVAIADSPVKAQNIANAIAEAYEEMNIESQVVGTKDAKTTLALKYEELKKSLDLSEDKLYEFMEENNVLNASLESQKFEVRQRIESFNEKLANVQGRLIEERGIRNILKSMNQAANVNTNTLEALSSSKVIQQLKFKLTELLIEEKELESRYKSAHPKLMSMRKRVLLVQESIEREVKDESRSLEQRFSSLVETEMGLKEALRIEREKEAVLNRLKKNYKSLVREAKIKENLFEMVTKRMRETDITSAFHMNNVSILERATLPNGAFRPSYRMNLGLSLILGILLALVLIFILELLDNTLKSQLDVEALMSGLSFLGIMPEIKLNEAILKESNSADMILRERDHYFLKNPKSTSAECLRFIRTNLLFMSPIKKLKIMTVTSPSPREGKTTTAIGLAATFADNGSRTLLVDADMRRPRLHRAFGIAADVGLSSCIIGESTLDDSVRATDMPMLDVLICGPIPPNPSELLHTESFSKVLEEMKSKYDRIIMDSPPSGLVVDATIIGRQVDGCVVVVKQQVTTKTLARQTLENLVAAKVPMLGVILNDVDLNKEEYGNKYYQSYLPHDNDENIPKSKRSKVSTNS